MREAEVAEEAAGLVEVAVQIHIMEGAVEADTGSAPVRTGRVCAASMSMMTKQGTGPHPGDTVITSVR